MQRFRSVCLALVSACLAIATPRAARPQYGGTLRVEMAATLSSVDPAASATDPAEAAARARLLPLVFETLTRVDEEGIRPALAVSWESLAGGRRWRIRMRNGVTLHDGSSLEPWQAATALRAVEPRWRIDTDGDMLIVELPEPADLPWALADVNHAVVVRATGGALLGTGPFRVERLDASTLALRAHDGYRLGRAFADSVRVQLNRSPTAQLGDLEAGRADLIGIQPTDARRVTDRGMRVFASRPLELVAIVFEPHRSGDAHARLRRTLANAIDRRTLCDVLLQKHAAPAVTIVPPWLSGRPAQTAAGDRPELSRQDVLALPPEQRELALRVDPADRLALLIAERVAVDAREAGLSLTVQTPTGLAPRPDARLVRVRLPATTPERSLVRALAALGRRVADAISPPGGLDGTTESVYRAEAALADSRIVVPVVHLEDLYAAGEHASSWSSPPVRATGEWDLADVWLKGERP